MTGSWKLPLIRVLVTTPRDAQERRQWEWKAALRQLSRERRIQFSRELKEPLSQGPSQSWGSGSDGDWRVRVVGGLETLPEAAAERAVVDGAANLEQPVGAAPGPAHLL